MYVLQDENDQKSLHRVTLADPRIGLSIEQYAYEAGFFRFHWHDSYEILIVLQGSAKVHVEGQVSILGENDILVINPLEGHATLLLEDPTILLLMHLDAGFFSDLDSGRMITFDCCSSAESRNLGAFPVLRYYFALTYRELCRNTKESRLYAAGAMQIFCAVLLRDYSNRTPKMRTAKSSRRQLHALRTIMSYTEKHFRDKLNLDELAQLVDMNRTYLSTFFRSHAGISFYEYLTRKRLAYAAHLLNNTDMPVLEIAMESGFPDAKALSASFRHYFNCSPGQYRRSLDKSLYPGVCERFPRYLDRSHPLVLKKVKEYIEENPSAES